MASHPIHPALVHFPLGLLLTASAADIAGAAGWVSEPRFAAIAMAAGLAMGLVAMGAGLIDFAKLPGEALPTAYRHMGAVGAAWAIYAAALYLRRDVLSGAAPIASGASLGASIAGAAMLALGGFYGGHLVYRYRAGVKPGTGD